MKLLCVNTKDIIINNRLKYGGRSLKEGEIYTTKGKPYISNGEMCYYIDGIGTKMCCRFTGVLDEKEEILLKQREFSLN